MSWEQLDLEVSEMFAEYTWHAEEIQVSYQIRAEQIRKRSREWSAEYRSRMRLNQQWREARRLYMRTYMNGYTKKRNEEDAEFRERKRKASREAMRRNYARKKGQIVPFVKRGEKPAGIPHRPHHCTVCKLPGHHRQACPTQQLNLRSVA